MWSAKGSNLAVKSHALYKSTDFADLIYYASGLYGWKRPLPVV